MTGRLSASLDRLKRILKNCESKDEVSVVHACVLVCVYVCVCYACVRVMRVCVCVCVCVRECVMSQESRCNFMLSLNEHTCTCPILTCIDLAPCSLYPCVFPHFSLFTSLLFPSSFSLSLSLSLSLSPLSLSLSLSFSLSLSLSLKSLSQRPSALLSELPSLYEACAGRMDYLYCSVRQNRGTRVGFHHREASLTNLMHSEKPSPKPLTPAAQQQQQTISAISVTRKILE